MPGLLPKESIELPSEDEEEVACLLKKERDIFYDKLYRK